MFDTTTNQIQHANKGKKDYLNERRISIYILSYRRRTLIWSKIKELARSPKPITHIIAASKHLSELESKIVDFSKTTRLISPDTKKNDVNNLLRKLEVHLGTMPDEELQDFVKDCTESSEHDESLDSPQNTGEKNGNTPDS